MRLWTLSRSKNGTCGQSLRAEEMETCKQIFSEYSNLVSLIYVSIADINFFPLGKCISLGWPIFIFCTKASLAFMKWQKPAAYIQITFSSYMKMQECFRKHPRFFLILSGMLIKIHPSLEIQGKILCSVMTTDKCLLFGFAFTHYSEMSRALSTRVLVVIVMANRY